MFLTCLSSWHDGSGSSDTVTGSLGTQVLQSAKDPICASCCWFGNNSNIEVVNGRFHQCKPREQEEEHGSRQGPSASIPRRSRVPKLKGYARSSQRLRGLPSRFCHHHHHSPLIVCDDKIDLISRLLSCHRVFDTSFLHTFNYSPPLLIHRSTMPFVVSAWYR